MTQKIGIFGTAGMARETRDIAEALGYSAVFVARSSTGIATCEQACDWIFESDLERYRDMQYVIGIGECAVRKAIALRYAGKLKFGNLIHPDATFGSGQRQLIESRQGVIICAGVRITCNVTVGDFTIFNLNAAVSHDSIIGNYSTISPQVGIMGNVELRECTWIGAGATINQGTSESKLVIGAHSIIGSGAVVLQNCDADSVYVGVPARKIK
jgi:sugar O-acyltransferase (sialic acid O-acetyltransferase NeuD family)